VEKLYVLRKEKKERMKFSSCWERLYQKKERKEIIISYSAKSGVWPHHTHTSFAFALPSIP
jgi:hypothetical protein